VTQRDAQIPGEYEHNARAADEKYCGTARGEDGPILRRLRVLAPVKGLVVGANGEWSRGVDTFIDDVARVASANPERFGCCHGPDQARGAIAAMARERVGRVALRAAAQVRIAALLAITGRPGAEPGVHRHPGYRTHDEWDRARDSTYVSFPVGQAPLSKHLGVTACAQHPASLPPPSARLRMSLACTPAPLSPLPQLKLI
jgi:hypothetical protein